MEVQVSVTPSTVQVHITEGLDATNLTIPRNEHIYPEDVKELQELLPSSWDADTASNFMKFLLNFGQNN